MKTNLELNVNYIINIRLDKVKFINIYFISKKI